MRPVDDEPLQQHTRDLLLHHLLHGNCQIDTTWHTGTGSNEDKPRQYVQYEHQQANDRPREQHTHTLLHYHHLWVNHYRGIREVRQENRAH